MEDLAKMKLKEQWFTDEWLQKRYLDTLHQIGVLSNSRFAHQLGVELVAKIKQQQKEINELKNFKETTERVIDNRALEVVYNEMEADYEDV